MKKLLILSLGLLTLAGSQAFTLPAMPEKVKDTYKEALKYVPTKEAIGQAWIVQKGLEYVPSQETVVATANSAKDAVIDGATVAKDAVVDGVKVAKDVVLDNATSAKDAVVNGAIIAKDATVDAAQGHPYIAAGIVTGVVGTGITYAAYKRYKKALIAATLVGAGYAAYTFCPAIDLSSIQR